MEFFERYDAVTGTVIDKNAFGCYVKEDKSGKIVFYYGDGMKGDRVQLSVRRIDLKKKRVTCVLDSVLEYSEIAA